jgi:hypothetical protein
MEKKRFNATSLCLIFAASLLLNGCNIFIISPEDVSGSCVYGDTETDTPVSLVTNIDSNLLYFGATDSPYKYEIESKSKDEITAVLKDSNALKSMYLIYSSLRLNIGSGSVVVENVPEDGLEHSSENTEVQATCTWFDKASYQTKLMEASQAFSQNTPAAIAQALSDGNSYEARAKGPTPNPRYVDGNEDEMGRNVEEYARFKNEQQERKNSYNSYNPPINLSIKSEYVENSRRNRWWLVIQSNQDKIRIENLIINRGNCSKDDWASFGTYPLPFDLEFGKIIKYELGAPNTTYFCDVYEVKIITDTGIFNFSFSGTIN